MSIINFIYFATMLKLFKITSQNIKADVFTFSDWVDGNVMYLFKNAGKTTMEDLSIIDLHSFITKREPTPSLESTLNEIAYANFIR